MRCGPIASMIVALTLPWGLPSALSDTLPAVVGGIVGVAELPGIFRFSANTPGPANLGEFQPACVGTFLTPRIAITAAHCLRGSETLITLDCRAANGERRVQAVYVTGQAHHPTHDLTLLRFGRLECDAASVQIVTTIDPLATYFALRPPSVPSAAGLQARGGARIGLTEVVHGPYTIEGVSLDGCLTRGDSGTPLWVEEDQVKWWMAGLLIAGAASCSGEQVFVRLDQVRGWMDAFLSDAR